MVDIGLQIIGGLVAKLCPTLVTPWTIAHQSPLSMGFSKQESWSGLPFPSPGYLPYSGIKFCSPALQVNSLPTEPPGEPLYKLLYPLQSFLCPKKFYKYSLLLRCVGNGG